MTTSIFLTLAILIPFMFGASIKAYRCFVDEKRIHSEELENRKTKEGGGKIDGSDKLDKNTCFLP